MPHAAVGQTLLPVLCLGEPSCEPCFASQTRRSCRPALQAWCALRSICLRGSVSDYNWQPPYVPYVHKRRQIRGRLSGLSCETNTGGPRLRARPVFVSRGRRPTGRRRRRAHVLLNMVGAAAGRSGGSAANDRRQLAAQAWTVSHCALGTSLHPCHIESHEYIPSYPRRPGI